MRQRNTKRKNSLIKDFISVLLFSYMVYASLYELPNVNMYFFIFMVTGLIFFTISTLYEGIRIYPKLKSKYQNREKLELSDSFVWHYLMYLIGITISCLSIWCAILIHHDYILFIIIGIGCIYGFGKYCLSYIDDLNKIENWKNKVVKKLLYKIK